MSSVDDENVRTVILSADDKPFPVVFEMGGETITVRPWGHLRLVVSGPSSAILTIGHGENGVSVFRDEALVVDVFDEDGAKREVPGFA